MLMYGRFTRSAMQSVREDKVTHEYMLSCRTKLCQLLCLKNRGRIALRVSAPAQKHTHRTCFVRARSLLPGVADPKTKGGFERGRDAVLTLKIQSDWGK